MTTNFGHIDTPAVIRMPIVLKDDALTVDTESFQIIAVLDDGEVLIGETVP